MDFGFTPDALINNTNLLGIDMVTTIILAASPASCEQPMVN
jgi:hypothetical protein